MGHTRSITSVLISVDRSPNLNVFPSMLLNWSRGPCATRKNRLRSVPNVCSVCATKVVGTSWQFLPRCRKGCGKCSTWAGLKNDIGYALSLTGRGGTGTCNGSECRVVEDSALLWWSLCGRLHGGRLEVGGSVHGLGFSTHVVGVEQGQGNFNSGSIPVRCWQCERVMLAFSRNHKMDSGTNT
jgi:hypothetical protein